MGANTVKELGTIKRVKSIGDYNRIFGTGKDGDVVISANTTLTTTQDGDEAVIECNSLTINSGCTLTVSNRCRGLVIRSKGDVTIHGTISMTGKGGATSPAMSSASNGTFVGTWNTQTDAIHLSGQAKYTTTFGSYCTLVFSGRRIGVLFPRNTTYGRIAVSIDGISYGIIDQYNQALNYQNLWMSPTLATGGTHTLRLEKADNDSKGIYIDCFFNSLPAINAAIHPSFGSIQNFRSEPTTLERINSFYKLYANEFPHYFGSSGGGAGGGTRTAGTAGTAAGAYAAGGGGGGGGGDGNYTSVGGGGNYGFSGGGAGGGGGGGCSSDGTGTSTGGAGTIFGGAGGGGGGGIPIGDAYHGNSGGGGGAGNNGGTVGGGSGYGYDAVSPAAGANGVGGLIVIISGGTITISSTGAVVANGCNGGQGSTRTGVSNVGHGGGGGGSGGGAIVFVYKRYYTNSGTVQANGGTGGTKGGGSSGAGGTGGAGSINLGQYLN